MKASFLAAASYESAAPRFGAWPVAPENCDREIAARSLRQTIENSRRAEELGFDWVSVSEHHYAPAMLTPNPLVLAGALSQALQHARIALLGPLLPLNNPVRVAEEIAMLDAMSDGRVIVLFLRGLAFEHNTYSPVGEKSREMTQEGIELILKAWTEPKPFAWEGRHYQFQSVSVWPRTRQIPHPPVFGSGNSEESALFAARHGFGLAMSFMPVSRLARMIDIYKTEAVRCGWTPAAEQILYRGLCAMDAPGGSDNPFDRAEAEARAKGEEVPLIVRGAYFTGDAASVLNQAERLRDAGAGVIDVAIVPAAESSGYADQAEALERFAREVLPELRSW
jgi:alkanesulfonate monooxygenase SsuD/methylene tetrahydromethanopterin reductase-like flavin-dependent oxidoreductase (luciferase family)